MFQARSLATLGIIAAGSDACLTRSLRSGLSDLLFEALAKIADAFVLVRVGRTQATHLCRYLPDFLPINPRHGQTRLFRIDSDINASGQRVLDRMGKPETEHNRALALHFGAVADANDFQFLGPSFGHAFD